jgi:hypothetical protein
MLSGRAQCGHSHLCIALLAVLGADYGVWLCGVVDRPAVLCTGEGIYIYIFRVSIFYSFGSASLVTGEREVEGTV